MAARSIDPAISGKVVAEWRTGEYSQQDLARKHKISKGMVNKLCKGVAQDVGDLVTAGAKYKQGLANLDDRIVTAVTEAVDERTKYINFFNNTQAKLAGIALKRIEQQTDEKGAPGEIFSMTELAQASAVVNTSRIGILGKPAETIINNTNAVQVNKVEYEVV